MAITVLGGALQGVDAVPIQVEVDLLRRLPSVVIVGLAASAVKESAERIRSAVEGTAEFPRKRVVINLAPADVRKEGTALDLPIALGILAADGQLPEGSLAKMLAVGELSLGGQLRPVRGATSLAILARELGHTLLLPRASAGAAALVPDVDVVGADDLHQVVAWLRGGADLAPTAPNVARRARSGVDLAEVRGQHEARAALELAAAGAHHLLMLGPPGCGKSMLARRLPTILPPMDFEEALTTTRVFSAAGILDEPGLLIERPFRAPHHSVTVAGLVGDRTLRPGEVSLAHNGVLFLDEAPEFTRSVLEVLRQPLEDGCITLSRAQGTVSYPAAITLVLAANPCPCGHRGTARCECTDSMVHRYQRRLSGPILDRVDMQVELTPVDPRGLWTGPPGESSADVRARVVDARARQRSRGQRVPNGQLAAAEVREVAALGASATDVLVNASTKLGLSGRAATRAVKVARTVADLRGSEALEESDLLTALAYRPMAGAP